MSAGASRSRRPDAADLHLALQDALGWADDHLYAFWLDGIYWSRRGVEFSEPHHAKELGDPETRSARVRLGDLALAPGQKIAYVFDFGDEWRVEITVARVDADDGGVYPRLLESIGKAPPQYPTRTRRTWRSSGLAGGKAAVGDHPRAEHEPRVVRGEA